MKNDKPNSIKKAGFKIPNNYFQSFDDKLFNKLSEETSVSNIKETGFKVPKNYFDTLEHKIIDEIKTKNLPIVKLYRRKTFYYIAGIAAALALFFSLIFNKTNSVEEFSVEIVETYLEKQNLDSYELAQLLSDTNILEEDFTIIETNFNEDNLESYLLDHADLEAYLE